MISPLAEADLVDIWAYVAADNPRAADQLLERLKNTMLQLSKTPGIGRARPELRSDLRSFPVKPYTIFYRQLDDPLGPSIEIVRILHGRRNILPDVF